MQKKEKVIIIGGISAGTSAAAKIRRLNEDIDIVIYERDKYISYATCGLPYFISGKIPRLSNIIINSKELFSQRFNLSVNTLHDVLSINPEEKTIKVKNLKTNEIFTDNYDKLIIATGTSSIDLKETIFDAANSFRLKTIDDAIAIKNFLDELEVVESESIDKSAVDYNFAEDIISTDVVIIGGGYISLELLEAFTEKKLKVLIIEKESQLLSMFDKEIIDYLENYLFKREIIILKNDSVLEVRKNGNNVINLIITENGKRISTKLVFLGVGINVENSLVKNDGVELGARGAIKTDQLLRTNIPDIFAIGDCIEIKNLVSQKFTNINLATTATKEGRTVAYNIFGADKPFKGSYGTTILKIFDIAIGKTGLNFKEAKKLYKNAVKIETHDPSHASYYPGYSMMHMLTIFDKQTGKILGFEAIGRDGIDKKVDVMATALKGNLLITDLASCDFAYHPAFGAAKDPVNLIGMTGENYINNDVDFISCEELKDKINSNEDFMLVDVRTQREYDFGHIENAVLITLDSFRDNLDKIDKNKSVVLYCRTGYRAYLAYRILKNKGFTNMVCLNGSYLSWIKEL
ncbi:MAG: FAD-dependent oxidoreductase [Cyanobacteria bacterium]|nr:FAD-dependent oxidoreductase [Cyanobacteriota bacterium]